MRAHRCNGDARRRLAREAIDARRDGREGDRAKPSILRDRQAGSVAAGEDIALAPLAALPDRPDGMDDMGGREPIAPGQPRLARRTTADRTAFREKPGPCGTVDRPVDAAAAEQRGICGIDDGVDSEPRNIAALQADVPAGGQVRDHEVSWQKKPGPALGRSRIKDAGGKPATGRLCRIGPGV